jgi:hypothetical protein
MPQVTVGTNVYFFSPGRRPFLHALLIAGFVAQTAPVTTIFLMRAALFRERQKGGDVPPPLNGDWLLSALFLDRSGHARNVVLDEERVDKSDWQ